MKFDVSVHFKKIHVFTKNLSSQIFRVFFDVYGDSKKGIWGQFMRQFLSTVFVWTQRNIICLSKEFLIKRPNFFCELPKTCLKKQSHNPQNLSFFRYFLKWNTPYMAWRKSARRTKRLISTANFSTSFVTKPTESFLKFDITWVHHFTNKCPTLIYPDSLLPY